MPSSAARSTGSWRSGTGCEIAVCGHVHYRRRHRAGRTLFIASCLGYAHEWPDPADAAGEVERALAVLEL